MADSKEDCSEKISKTPDISARELAKKIQGSRPDQSLWDVTFILEPSQSNSKSCDIATLVYTCRDVVDQSKLCVQSNSMISYTYIYIVTHSYSLHMIATQYT